MNKVDLLEVFLDDESPDVFCLSEHGMKNFELENLNINNFKYVTSFCRSQASGGGVAIWCRPELKCLPLDCEAFCEERECELSAITIEVSKKDKLLVVAGYRPPSGRNEVFLELLGDCLNKFEKTHTKTVVLGDFNIDLSIESFTSHRLT